MPSVGAAIAAILRKYLGRGDFLSRAQLDRLIRIRPHTELGPDARMPVLGALGVATPHKPITPYEDVSFICENGLALVIGSASRIFADTDLAAYFSGSGDVWGWGATEHAQGTISSGAQACASGSAPTWDGVPTLDAFLSYASAAAVSAINSWFGTANRAPGSCTGLLRLAAQACGPHRNISEYRPTVGSWVAWDPKLYGIVRQVDSVNATLRWWLIYIGSAGCRAVELIPNSVSQCIVDGLYDGSWSGDQAIRAEAWVLRLAAPAQDDDGIELIDSATVTTAFDNKSFLVHGWHWSPQKWGTASETQSDAVVMVYAPTTTGNYYWNTRGLKLSITFDASGPIGAISVEQTGSPSLNARHSLWWFDTAWLLYSPTSTRETTTAGFIWARYKDSGPEWIDYDGETVNTVGADADPRAAYNTCGGSGSVYVRAELYSRTTFSGGFDFPSAATDYVSGVGDDQVYDFQAGTDTQITSTIGLRYCSTYYAYVVNSVINVCVSDSDISPGTNTPCEIWQKSCTYAREKVSWGAGGGHGSALILTQDPTVVIGCKDSSRLIGAGGGYSWSTTQTLAGRIDIQGHGVEVANVGGINSALTYGSSGSIIYFNRDEGYFSCNQSGAKKTLPIAIQDRAAVAGDQFLYDGDFVYVVDATLSSASETIILSGDHDDWKAWARPTDFGGAGSLVAIASYAGDLIYNDVPGGSNITDDGYDSERIAAATGARFLGGV